MGLGIVSFTIRDIRESKATRPLGKPRIAQVKRDAQIASEADRMP
jgi:uncharacterized membrane protein YqiK